MNKKKMLLICLAVLIYLILKLYVISTASTADDNIPDTLFQAFMNKMQCG